MMSTVTETAGTTETAVAKPWTLFVGGVEVKTTSIMIMRMRTTKMMIIDPYLPDLLRQQHLGMIFVGGIRFPCVVIMESLPLQGNDRVGPWAMMTKMRGSTMGGG